ncbi:MAG TPA: thioredoxin domain-containing protein [Gemmataceae bacterium]|nr:thioredoxin domain-containing protein [Gemmataceae bacterium]
MLRPTWRWLRRGLTLGMLLLLLVRLLPADPHPSRIDTPEPPADKGKHKHTNRLARETSPYLLQHAHNPVAWYPWGEEAFAKAKKEGKLVFLSIGYSSCHWCHVMERESFENEEIAKILNRDFVCIKVDREERPDIDNVYMTAVQVIPPGQGGGWPLSMFLTPDGKPILGGTYWPPDDKEIKGVKVRGFKTILKVVQEAWSEQRKPVTELADKNAAATRRALAGLAFGLAVVPLNRDLVAEAVEAIKERVDPKYGGFGSPARDFRGPKFPTPARLALLQHEARREKAKERAKSLNDLVALTLDHMARGGIYDQLGGGFHRYSTERTWTVPHFEKMLYDNAQLCEVYAEAYKTTKKRQYRRVLEQTIAFIRREMTAPEGGFYSALDADAQGEEGRFYVWTPKEMDAAFGETDKSMAALFKRVYGVDGEPNFESEYHILTLPRSLADQAKDLKMTEEQLEARLAPLRDQLLQVRTKRPRPFLDTKILTAWNGQMIAGLAAAGQALGDKKAIDSAARAADFILKTLRTDKGRLLRSYAAAPGQKAQARLNAYLDDYAFLVHGLLGLHDVTKEQRWLDEAKRLTDSMVQLHNDDKQGGFFYTSTDHEKLFARGKEQYDGAQPSSNSIAARNLVRLWHKTGEERYARLAEKTFQALAGPLKENPAGLTALADALGMYLEEKAARKK